MIVDITLAQILCKAAPKTAPSIFANRERTKSQMIMNLI